MAFTAREERRVKDALDSLTRALYMLGSILQDHGIDDERLTERTGDVWRFLRAAEDHVDAIRTTAVPARPQKEAADVLPG